MGHPNRHVAACGLVAVAMASLFLYGCAGANSVPQPQTATQMSAAPLAVPPVTSINELMVAWIDHAGHELWNAEREGHAPKTDADWRQIERHAIQLAASGTLVALGGTGQADPGWAQSPLWKKYSQDLNNAGKAALAAARSKNLDALIAANGQLAESCQQCHDEFKPELPTEKKIHQPQ